MPLALDGLVGVAFGNRRIISTWAGQCLKIDPDASAGFVDVGFIGDRIDLKSLFAIGGSTIYVNKAYDQTGNGRHFDHNAQYLSIYKVIRGVNAVGLTGRPCWSCGAGAIPGAFSTYVGSASNWSMLFAGALLRSTDNSTPGVNTIAGDGNGYFKLTFRQGPNNAADELFVVAMNCIVGNAWKTVEVEVPRYGAFAVAARMRGGQLSIRSSSDPDGQSVASAAIDDISSAVTTGISGGEVRLFEFAAGPSLTDEQEAAWGAEAMAALGGTWGPASGGSYQVAQTVGARVSA